MFEFAFKKKLWSASGEMWLQVQQQLEPGSFVTLYGQSGAGKTSLLRILAGLLSPDAGHISGPQGLWLDTSQGINRAPKDRQVGMLFQDYALFPNMTVQENLRFACSKAQQGDMQGTAGKGRRSPLIQDLLETMELGELRHRKPATLSGGQQQRVALARALVQRPKLLMLDEPLSALDQAMRLRLQQYILRVHREFGLTTLLVSHDLAEIWRLSDQVWVMEQGKIIRQGTPAQVFTSVEQNPGQQNPEQQNVLQVVGEILAIKREGPDWQLTVLVERNIIQVLAEPTRAEGLEVGDRILITTHLHQPTIQKLQ